MAKTNPYPWVMPAVAAANGYGAGGGGGLNASFDPTNPGRRNRRPALSGDDGGIGGAINAVPSPTLKSPADIPNAANTVSSIPNYSQLVADAKQKAADLAGQQSASMRAPMRFGGALLTDSAATAAGSRASDITQNQNLASVYSNLAAKNGQPVSAVDPGPISAPPPAVASASSIGAGNAPAAQPVLWNPSTTQMRAGGAVPTTPRNSIIDTGVTLPDGRKLAYGAMVNGVPTFSDGSGGMPGKPGTIPRTMTQGDIKALGDRLPTVPASTAFLQAPSAFNSPDSESNIEAIMRSQQGGKFGITPEMRTAADLAAVTNQDARTTLGRAAMNAGRRASAATSVLQRKSALDDLAGLNAAVRANALATTQGQNAVATANAEGQSALRRTELGGLYDIAGQRVRNEGDLARTGLAGQYDIATALAKPNAATSLDPDKVNSDAVKLLPQVLGLDPAGQVMDPSTGKPRAPTRDEIAQGLQTARAMLTGQHQPAAQASAVPKVGSVVGGYRFKGGNPNDQNNWEKVG